MGIPRKTRSGEGSIMAQPLMKDLLHLRSDKVVQKTEQDAIFNRFVHTSIQRFFTGDWGEIRDSAWSLNDRDNDLLNDGKWGRVIAQYSVYKNGFLIPAIPMPQTIVIIRELLGGGQQSVTIKLRSEV